MSFLQRLFGPPSRPKFAKLVVNGLRRQGEKRPIALDQDKFHVRIGDSQVISLENIYQEYCRLPRARRPQHLRMLIDTFLVKDQLPTDFAEARKNLRPKIYLRATMEFMQLANKLGKGPAPEIPVYPLGGHLYSSLVYDLPTSMRSIAPEDLETWGVTYYEALEAAVENLEETTVAWAKIGDNFLSACSGDNYNSGRVLLIDRIRSFGLRGTPIAMVPQRDEVYVTSEDDEDGLKMMAELAAKAVSEQPRPISPLPLRLVDGEWEDWFPSPDHKLYPQFHELRLGFLASLYEDQKKLLEELFEKEGRDVFVASFSGIQVAGQLPVSYCVWIEGLPSLLPETDYITLLRQDAGVVASGRLADVRRIVGDLIMEDPEYYPVRFAVDGFPSGEQLERIGHHLKGS